MKILGVIPARFASTRFPGKPLALINGKSMIQRTYEQVLKAQRIDAAIVATDDERIAEAVKSFGGTVAMTSSHHRSGTDRCREVLENYGSGFDAVVNIQGDEPFIDPRQIDQVAELISRENIQLASLAKSVRDAEELFSPNAVKVVMNAEGKALYFSRSVIPYLRGVEKESWFAQGKFYKHIGIYAYRSEVLKAISDLPQSSLEKAESLEQLRWLENGFSIQMGVTAFESLSIDTPSDLENAEKYDREQMKNVI